mgnify:FL=1
MRYFTAILFFLVFSGWGVANAQQANPDFAREMQQDTAADNDSGLGLKIRKYQGDVLIKIVPRQTEAFIHFKNNGWHLERARVSNGDTSNFQQLNDEPLRPASRERWEQLARDNRSAGAILELLFPEPHQQVPQTFMDQLESHTTLNNRHFFYLFLSADNRDISEASGLEYRHEISGGSQQYVYRAFIKGYEDSTGHSGSKTVEMQYVPEQYRAPELEGGGLDSAALLSWNHTDYDDVFVSYDLERSQPGDDYSRITDVPLVYNRQTRPSDTAEGSMYHVDSLKENGVRQHYRLVAHDYFGISSQPSNVVKVEGKDQTAPPAPTRLRAQPTSRGVEIVWQYPHESEDLAGFYVVRSGSSLDGPYSRLHKELLQPGRMQYVDESSSPDNNRYYAVAAFDEAGNFRMSDGISAAVRDTVPPDPPVGLEARLDSSRGLVALRWNTGEADDITGYRVFRSLSRDYEFVQVTDTPTVYNAYVDTLNLNALNSKVYYKVVAVDDRWNHSRFSDVLEVSRPDTIAPTRALLTGATYGKGMVRLEWEPSSSQDVEKQYVMYRGEGQNQWQVLDSLRGNEKDSYSARLTDTTRAWQLAIQTVDDNGLHSGLSNIRKVVVDSYNPVPPVDDFQAENGGGDQVQLSWETPPKAQNYRLMLYRAQGEGQPLLYETLEGSRAAYTDSGLEADTTYRYQVALKRKSDGVVSQSSEIRVVEVNP